MQIVDTYVEVLLYVFESQEGMKWIGVKHSSNNLGDTYQIDPLGQKNFET